MNNHRQSASPTKNQKSRNATIGKITALYERLSREDGEDSVSNSIVNQQAFLEDYAKKNGFKNLVHFADDGYTGTNFERPNWKKLIAEIEAGNVENLILKDMTRFGRDHVSVGMFMEKFRQKGVRFIAISNSIDSIYPDTLEFAPFINIMSEWYARDTSRKIKTAVTTKGKSGKRITVVPIYGFMLDPQDKTKWLVDEEAAEIVRRIFTMTIEGKGVQQIAKTLATENVERTSYYMKRRGFVNYNVHGGENTKYDWNAKTIADLIAKPEYMGHTVNFRTTKESYKDRRRKTAPQEDWLIFKDTHPAIVDEETWNLAQKCRETKRRPRPINPEKENREANPLTGLMVCADCGKRMYNHREEKTGKMYYHKQIGKWYPRSARDFYACPTYCDSNTQTRKCTQHYIRTTVVRELTLDMIKSVSGYVRENEADFVRQIRERSELETETAARASRKSLAKNIKRHAELDTVISKLFEQNAAGKIADARFEILLAGYEAEQAELAQSIEQMQAEIDGYDNDSNNAEMFVQLAKKFTDFSELTPQMLHEYVEKIVVHEGVGGRGNRTQKVEIFFNFIGQFDMPTTAHDPTPEEIAEDEKLQRQRERKKKNYRTYIEKRQRELAQEQAI
jgi:DNA invertase Pin-like site-specific DNA recombinase